jgi:hypothetical protein
VFFFMLNREVSLELSCDTFLGVDCQGLSRLQRGGCEARLAVIAEASQFLAAPIHVQDHYVSQTHLSGCGKVRKRMDHKPLDRSLQVTSAVPVVSSFG